jgi:transcriptional regulator with XRE-family HTH domain
MSRLVPLLLFLTNVIIHDIFDEKLHEQKKKEGQDMSEARESAIAIYSAERRKAIKRMARQLRQETGFSQEEVAGFLGCSRGRVTAIEREESDTVYDQGELELLATLFGRHPLDMLLLAGQDAIALAGMMTAKLTGNALGPVVDCHLPKQLATLLLIDESPGSLVFSPTGRIMASIVDSSRGESLSEEEEAYQPTLLCWETQSGMLRGQILLPDIGEIALLDEARVAIAITAWRQDDEEVRGYADHSSHLYLWEVGSRKLRQLEHLPNHIGKLAISPDGAFLAAYLPAITTVRVWRTSNWEPVKAFEIGINDAPYSGFRYGSDARGSDLPGELKFTPGAGSFFEANRFEFLDEHTLVVRIETGHMEVDVRPSSVGSEALSQGLRDFPRLTHACRAQGEIAVRSIEYDHSLSAGGDSSVELYYAVPKGDEFLNDVTVEKRLCGTVRGPLIIDEACILAGVSYDTPYQHGRGYKQRAGLVNLISGRIVLLGDQGRLASGDDQIDVCISPRGDVVAYWVFPDKKGIPRLSLQYIDTSFLRAKGTSLADELERHRKRWAEEDETYRRWQEREDTLLEESLSD